MASHIEMSKCLVPSWFVTRRECTWQVPLCHCNATVNIVSLGINLILSLFICKLQLSSASFPFYYRTQFLFLFFCCSFENFSLLQVFLCVVFGVLLKYGSKLYFCCLEFYQSLRNSLFLRKMTVQWIISCLKKII